MKMMKSILLLCLTAGIIVSCKNNYANHDDHGDKQAVATNDPANLTQVQWLDSVKDFGTINEGQRLEVSFKFKNVGSKPLVIERVQPSCGCTIPDPPKEAIAPGAEGEIKGVFDSNGRVGPNHKTMTVYANIAQPRDLVFNVVVVKKGGDTASHATNH